MSLNPARRTSAKQLAFENVQRSYVYTYIYVRTWHSDSLSASIVCNAVRTACEVVSNQTEFISATYICTYESADSAASSWQIGRFFQAIRPIIPCKSANSFRSFSRFFLANRSILLDESADPPRQICGSFVRCPHIRHKMSLEDCILLRAILQIAYTAHLQNNVSYL